MALLLGTVAWTLSSCQDWLTIYPQNQIVEENFWEDKSDLEGVRYAAYQQMCNTMQTLALWGDLRSDSYKLNSTDRTDDGTVELYQEIREGRIERDSASTYFEWTGIYQTINYCNKVLQHGPEVLARDKQFTTAEWLQMKAEITGLRALNYFYLIRAFKDVPYSTKVVNNDSEVMYFGATNQLVVLDSLIADVESVKSQARNRFGKTADTKGLITNAALYALLSDMYLWRASLHEGRYGKTATDTVYITNVATNDSNYVVHTVEGDYKLAIKYADDAMEYLDKQNDRSSLSFGSTTYEMLTYGLNHVRLYKNQFTGFANGNTPDLIAYEQIFGGNSEEGIFELQFSTDEKREHSLNGGSDNPGGPWGNSNYTHLTVSDAALKKIYESASDDRPRDSRLWFSAWNQLVGQSQASADWYCFKWSNTSRTSDNRFQLAVQSDRKCQSMKVKFVGSKESNWIVYRLSDVMLQKAEALAAIGQNTEALKYVNALHRRWFCNDAATNEQPDENLSSTLGNAPSAANAEIAVLNERQLEFLGEGKRWFDLVRYAERHAGGQDDTKDPREWTEENPVGNGLAGVKDMVNTLMEGEFSKQMCTQLINRFKNRYGLYNLIYYKEIQAGGGKLEQNPVWNKSMYD